MLCSGGGDGGDGRVITQTGTDYLGSRSSEAPTAWKWKEIVQSRKDHDSASVSLKSILTSSLLLLRLTDRLATVLRVFTWERGEEFLLPGREGLRLGVLEEGLEEPHLS